MISLVLTVTEACNCNCAYCLLRGKPRASMRPDVLDTVFSRIGEWLRLTPSSVVELLWHGGEPLLLGVDGWQRVLQLQDLHCQGGRRRILHSIQSNLTCLDEPMLQALEKLPIRHVGASIDPEPGVRGLGPKVDSALALRRCLEGIALLERHALAWGLIYVVTGRSLHQPEALFHYLTNLNLAGRITFNPVVAREDSDHGLAVRPVEYARFLGAFFQTWWEHRDRYPDVQPLRSIMDHLTREQSAPGAPTSAAEGDQQLRIAPDGTVESCRKPSDGASHVLGHLSDAPLQELLARDQQFQREQLERVRSEPACQSCIFLSMCRGGRAMDTFSYDDECAARSEWCDARRMFVEEYVEPALRSPAAA